MTFLEPSPTSSGSPATPPVHAGSWYRSRSESSSSSRRLLDGPEIDGIPESLAAHIARLGRLPRERDPQDVIEEIKASGLLGRGGAGFAVGCKWRAIADRSAGRAVVVVNGAEGEPASAKDRTLMIHRPHLVVDGAILAADVIGADEIVFYIGVEHEAAARAIGHAIEERGAAIGHGARLVRAPIGYVAGEASAAVHQIDDGDARPTGSHPRVSERGVGGRPTLVQNVESLAYAALIARFGDRWYRSAGLDRTAGTGLITVSGPVDRPAAREIELGTTIGEIAATVGARRESLQAIVLGGYFGTWTRARDAWDMPLDPVVMREHGLTFGCGIVGFLPASVCGVAATASIMAFMARESAGQCGPCVFGLRGIGEATARLAGGEARADDLDRIELLAARTTGRGACHHPDGAVQLLTSALDVFGEDFLEHARAGRCGTVSARRGAA
jgi:NADH:ubiquinone oxidoreductase subunit F (NADH-binding)